MIEDIEKLKFPIGKFQAPEIITQRHIEQWITVIRDFPLKLDEATATLNAEQLEKQYRPNGWTIRQLVHHCADSHMNSFIRLKLTLTEDTPTIKSYMEHLWAEQPDYKLPIESSINIIKGLHQRWSNLLTKLAESELEKQFIHPDHHELISLKQHTGIYAWHCKHHLAHILLAKNS